MKQTITDLKAQYIKYFEDAPVQKYAAMSIKRDEDTIIRWKNEDKAFADQVEQASAEFVRKLVIASKAEFVLERMFKDVFTPAQPVCMNCRVNPIEKLKESKDTVDSFAEYMMKITSDKLLAKSRRGDQSILLPVSELA